MSSYLSEWMSAMVPITSRALAGSALVFGALALPCPVQASKAVGPRVALFDSDGNVKLNSDFVTSPATGDHQSGEYVVTFSYTLDIAPACRAYSDSNHQAFVQSASTTQVTVTTSAKAAPGLAYGAPLSGGNPAEFILVCTRTTSIDAI
jgi:hypothetical protein